MHALITENATRGLKSHEQGYIDQSSLRNFLVDPEILKWILENVSVGLASLSTEGGVLKRLERHLPNSFESVNAECVGFESIGARAWTGVVVTGLVASRASNVETPHSMHAHSFTILLQGQVTLPVSWCFAGW